MTPDASRRPFNKIRLPRDDHSLPRHRQRQMPYPENEFRLGHRTTLSFWQTTFGPLFCYKFSNFKDIIILIGNPYFLWHLFLFADSDSKAKWFCNRMYKILSRWCNAVEQLKFRNLLFKVCNFGQYRINNVTMQQSTWTALSTWTTCSIKKVLPVYWLVRRHGSKFCAWATFIMQILKQYTPSFGPFIL